MPVFSPLFLVFSVFFPLPVLLSFFASRVPKKNMAADSIFFERSCFIIVSNEGDFNRW